MTFPVCPCDDDAPDLPLNPPELDQIGFRYGTYPEFRRAVLTPMDGEQSLPAWRTQGQGDLAVMMAEQFAYLADILTFYDERIANEAYLRTANLDASVRGLIRLLGYRPRPAIGATGAVAALVTPGQSAVLPKGLQIQSKPAPGHPPQTFELAADTPIGPPDRVSATLPPYLLETIDAFRFKHLSVGLEYALPVGLKHGHLSQVVSTPHLIGFSGPTANYGALLRGAVDVDAGAILALKPRDPALGPWLAATVVQCALQPAPGGGQQTALALDIAGTPPAELAAAQAALRKPNQTVGLWKLFGGAIDGAQLHLAGLARQIGAGDHILISGGGLDTLLTTVTATSEAIWDATGTSAAPATPANADHPFPVPHTVLTLAEAPSGHAMILVGAVVVAFDWIGVGKLLDQPPGPWSGAPGALVAATAQRFLPTAAAPVLLMDASGAGASTTASSAGDLNVQVGALRSAPATLQPPIDLLYNVLPVTRGKTVAKEVVGGGDATVAGQSFTLSQSPVTYLQQGAGYASTIALRVDGELWTEVASFYGQPPNAQVFVTREDADGKTHVDFGDGVNGARLPTGSGNVVATYRVGAGADAPAAGKLTVIAKAFPGLRSLLNPVAVGGGADPDPPNQIRRYAPRSVLTFGRAVSVFDYEALAAQTPGVTRARAAWSWSDAWQRSLVTVYVGDDAAAVVAARAALASAGDPNRPVTVTAATKRTTTLDLTLLYDPAGDPDVIAAAAVARLADPVSGLFAPANLAVGQPLFESWIEAAVLSVPGAVAITGMVVTVGGVAAPGPLHDPGEGGYFALDPDDVTLVAEAGPHGG